MDFRKISVIGLGYIGLPTAAMFASRKLEVIGVDINSHVVDTINKGQIHIVEPDLDILVHAAVTEGYMRASLAPEPADAFLIAVPTPFKDGYEPDLSYIENATRIIAKVLKKGDLVILESTSPVGTTEQMAVWLAEERPDLSFPQQTVKPDINVAHCPERVLPGHVVRELIENDRVIGGMTNQCSQRAVTLYKTFVQGECIVTNARTAEMAKLTENSFRDVNIAFANELSIICDKQKIDVWELVSLVNRHPRVNVLQPGPGVGGHCIAVDPWFIVSQNRDEAKLITQARKTNDYKREWVVEKIEEKLSPLKKEVSTIACLGLAFKPDIDDLRESPAKEIVNILCKKGHAIFAVEPNIDVLPKVLEQAGNITLVPLQKAINNSDLIVILVKHKEFVEIGGRFNDMRVLDFVGIF